MENQKFILVSQVKHNTCLFRVSEKTIEDAIARVKSKANVRLVLVGVRNTTNFVPNKIVNLS